MGSILGALAEAVGLGWIFRPLDLRPAYRRPHPLLRAAGTLLWVAVGAERHPVDRAAAPRPRRLHLYRDTWIVIGAVAVRIARQTLRQAMQRVA